MKTVKSLLVIAGMCFSTACFSQISGFKKDNVLLPEKLIISEQVGFDTLYQFPCDSFKTGRMLKPFFDLDKKIDFLTIIAEKAVGGSIKVFDAINTDEYYPYSALVSNRELAVNSILKGLGQDTFRVISSDGFDVERLSVKVIQLEELTSMNFVEEWALSADPLCFTKKVRAIDPIRRYSDYNDDLQEYRYRKVFRLYNNQSSGADRSPLKLAAKIKYEHFFNLDLAYMADNFQKLVEKNFLQNENSFVANQLNSSVNTPFFNGFNQHLFIQTLLNNVFSGKANAADFYTSKPLTAQEARDRVFQSQPVIIIDSYTGEEVERTIENDYTSEIVSVIFIEEWYFNEDSLSLEKKVIGIAPVRYYFDRVNQQDRLKREILFVVDLKAGSN